MSMKIKKYLSYLMLLILFLTIFFSWVTLTLGYKDNYQHQSTSDIKTTTNGLLYMMGIDSSSGTAKGIVEKPSRR